MAESDRHADGAEQSCLCQYERSKSNRRRANSLPDSARGAGASLAAGDFRQRAGELRQQPTERTA